MINNYNVFINEKRDELLLEANIKFDNEFKKVLSSMDSSLSNILLSFTNKEVDINTNYISYDIKKDDKVLFKPDDKVEKTKLLIVNDNEDLAMTLDSITSYIGVVLKKEYNIDDNFNWGQVYDYINIDDIIDIDTEKVSEFIDNSNHYNRYGIKNFIIDRKLAIIKSSDDYGYKSIFLVDKTQLSKNYSIIKDSEMSVGRFVRAFLKKVDVKFDDKDIEKFVNEYKTIMRIKRDSFKNFEEVSGNDIKKYYLYTNYANRNNGTLGKSCMKHVKCQRFLDIYTKNPKQVSMIILKETGNDLICGRALLWTNRKGDRFMDRIYTNDTSREIEFIEYAIFNGFYYKEKQNYDIGTLVFNKVVKKGYFKVYLDDKNFDKYPYMDTLKFLYLSEGSLTSESFNGDDQEYHYSDDDDNLILTNVEGGHHGTCEFCNGDEVIECSECEGRGERYCSDCGGSGIEDCSDCDGYCDLKCFNCDGEGTVEDVECSDCSGSGRLDCSKCNAEGSADCDVCKGNGKNTCNNCNGRGEYQCYEC